MQTPFRVLAILATSLLFFTGCDDSESSTLKTTELGPSASAAQCEMAARCGFAPSQKFCQDSLDLTRSQDWVEMMAEVDSGIIKYDGAKAAQCVEDFRSRDCTSDSDILTAACRDTFVGTLANGASCYTDESCVSGECNIDWSCEDACCTGTCVAEGATTVVAMGGTCDDMGAECDYRTSYCKRETFDAPTGICTALVAIGGACEGWECANGAYCKTDSTGTNGVCTANPKLGEDCTDTYCPNDSYCDGNNKCVSVLAVGAACNDGTDECVRWAYCASGTCTAMPVAGDACDEDADLYCYGNLECINKVCGFAPAPQPCAR